MVLCIGRKTGSGAAPQPGGPGGAEPPQLKQIKTDFIYFKTVSFTTSDVYSNSPAILLKYLR